MFVFISFVVTLISPPITNPYIKENFSINREKYKPQGLGIWIVIGGIFRRVTKSGHPNYCQLTSAYDFRHHLPRTFGAHALYHSVGFWQL